MKIKHLKLISIPVTLIFYGIICRYLSLNFFWESLYIGIITLLFLLFIIIRKSRKKLYILMKFILILSLLFTSIISIVLSTSKPYKVAKEYILKNNNIEVELGEIHSFGYITNGSINKKKDVSYSELKIIVKGDIRINEVLISLQKKSNGNWKVISYNFLY